MYNKLIKIALLAVAIGALSNPIAASANDTDGNRQETIGFAIEEMVCAPASEVWDAVFTPQGMKQLGMAQSSIDYRVGGMLMRRVGEGGKLGDDQTIVTRIISIDYGRMISLVPVTTPKIYGKFFPEAVSTYYYTPIGENQTLVRVATGNFPSIDEARALLGLSKDGTRKALDTLRLKYLDRCTKDTK